MKSKLLRFKNVLIAIHLLFFSAASFAQPVKTEILWDKYGVPHIYGKTTADMYYAFGWAQMHNHANLVLELYGQARGRAAEYWGRKYYYSDLQVNLFELRKLAQQVYVKQQPEYKSYLDAFVNGMNAYAKIHPEAIGKEFKQVLPVTPFDILAHTANVFCLDFVAGDNLYNSFSAVSAGSNAMAIAPARSASKNAMLIANPHLPWRNVYTFFEAHLNAPGFSAYGATLIGMPILAIAFNNNLGWTHTVNTIIASNRYELTLKDDGYLLDGKVIPFEKRNIVLKVKQDDGTIKDMPMVLKSSKQGPVIGEKDGKAFAVRIAGLTNAHFIEQYHRMAKANSFAEFEPAIKMLQMPMFNMVYADKAGNIMYLSGGNVPVRSEGDFNFWYSAIDGTQSRYIWTKTHPYADLPKVINPKTAFVQNSNDPPWTCTYPTVLDPKKYPGYMGPVEMGLRPQRGVNMVKNRYAITFDQLVAIKMNTGLESADRLLDDLLKASAGNPDTLATKAAMVLKAWDRQANNDSKGAVLFTTWFDDINPDLLVKNQWSFAQPVSTPNGIDDTGYAVNILVKAAKQVIAKYGSLDVAWGTVHRFSSGGIDLPGNGAEGDYGVYRVIDYNQDKDNKKKAVGGDSYVAITEFGPKVKAMVLMSNGNASQPGSKHIGDQLKLMSEKKLRPALLDKSDVMKNLEEKEVMH